MVAACLGGGLLATEAAPHVMMMMTMLLQPLGIVVRIVAGVRLLAAALLAALMRVLRRQLMP
jgi:Trk-type K+ transport system membrane component